MITQVQQDMEDRDVKRLSDSELRLENKTHHQGPIGPNPRAVDVTDELDRRFGKMAGACPARPVEEQIEYYRRRFLFTLTDKELYKGHTSLLGKRSLADRKWRRYYEDEIGRRRKK